MTTKSSCLGARLAIGLLVAGALTCSAAAAGSVWAAGPPSVIYTVTQATDDAVPVPANCPANAQAPNCSLRDAVGAALALPTPSNSGIVFSASGQYTLINGAIDINPSGRTSITVTGFNSSAGGTVLDGNNADRLFNVHLNTIVTLSLNNLTLQHGAVTTSGGAIFNGATVNLSNVVIRQSSAGVNGGAIENPGTLNIDQSTLSGNTAAASGGAIDDPPAQVGSLLLTRSTVSGNTASNGAGGGISNFGGLTQLFNDTLYGNTAGGTAFPAGAGGGLFAGGAGVGSGSQGNTDITYVTLSGNSARTGGGVFNDNVNGMSLRDNILTANTPANCAGTQAVGSLGYNLQFGGSAADSCQFLAQNKPGDIAGQNPLLGAPANNGGATLTMLPAAGSPAIDTIPSSDVFAQCPLGPPYPFSSDDQRLLTRPQGTACDMGAVEVRVAPTTPSVAPPAPPNTGLAGASNPMPGSALAIAIVLLGLIGAGTLAAVGMARRRQD